MRAVRVIWVLLLQVAMWGGPAAAAGRNFPNVILVTVDTLRADHLSGYGFESPTSPAIDRLMAAGVRFTEARTVEPLTAPALASMITSLPPHEHGSTRNGLRIRPNLPSFVKILKRRNYETAAFVGNWTLQDRLSGLGEHFGRFEEVLTRKRWLVMLGEATAEDINEQAIEWLDDQLDEHPEQPFLLWVHYVEPHSPYRLQEDFLDQLGLKKGESVFSSALRYQTEVAFVDHAVGEFLAEVGKRVEMEDTVVVFTSDHGESLGEHDYWGHGRHLYDATLRIPMSITWPGKIEPGVIEAPAVISDIPTTIFGLAGFPIPEFMNGFDWSTVIRGEVEPPMDRLTFYQSHRGSVKAREKQVKIRRRGLLEVGCISGPYKEIIHTKEGLAREQFDLVRDPHETRSRVPLYSKPSAELTAWLAEVEEGLALSDSLPPPSLSNEDMDELRSLGYID